VEEEPRPVRQRNSRVDRDLGTIVMKCLEKDPERRYASARDLAEDLGRWLQGEPIHAYPPSTIYRVRKFLGRRKAVVAMAVGAAAAVGLTVALLVPRWLGEKRARGEEREASLRREADLRELGALWSQVVLAKQMIYQPHRRPAEIRAELEAAAARVTEFLDRRPDAPQGWYVRARSRLYLGNLDGAEADLRKAIAIDAAFAPGWALLARVLLDRHARMMYGGTASEREARERSLRGLIDQAGDALRRAGAGGGAIARWGLPATPEDVVAETVAQAMREHFVNGRTAEAVELLKAAHGRAASEEYCRLIANWSGDATWQDRGLELAPHFAAGYFDRGGRRAISGDREGAIADFTRVVEIEPGHAMALANRGVAKKEKGDLPGALEDLNRAIDLAPRDPMSWSNRGALKQDLGDPDGAIADLDRAIELDSSATKAHYTRGISWLDKNEPARAQADFSKTLDLDPRYVEAYNNRGMALAMQGDFDGAIKDFDAALELRPRYPRAWFNRGLALWKKHDVDGAIAAYSRAIDIDSRYADALANRGIACRAKGDLKAAAADFEKAIEVCPPGWPNRATVQGWLQAVR
jgi:tetratricopeptide (TPR) repeat protein